MENILVSACLYGENCKYNGGNNYNSIVEKLKKKFNVVEICPEMLGGLKTPRTPAERVDNKVITKAGKDVSSQYALGANTTLKIAIKYNCKFALLKERSPSCGSKFIYNGHFNGTVISGMGVTAELLLNNGIKVYSEENISEIL